MGRGRFKKTAAVSDEGGVWVCDRHGIVSERVGWGRTHPLTQRSLCRRPHEQCRIAMRVVEHNRREADLKSTGEDRALKKDESENGLKPTE